MSLCNEFVFKNVKTRNNASTFTGKSVTNGY
nr:MAG TPA: hypothetical protein [Caudoviricetes sp.]DAZ55534.1 MAG TPA: hypothetical protein [Caudoviricetes sp.]